MANEIANFLDDSGHAKMMVQQYQLEVYGVTSSRYCRCLVIHIDPVTSRLFWNILEDISQESQL
jgi:hypothetical protein